ncbi:MULTISPECIES: hypothetical protein [unclassified Streptomyces]|uniref:hypothetical protein n=1 Tax=unclassified Streptomyces TaxID=2593676 RepID=UPI0011612997|nr:hypothetical protein [Streptomyces sp. TSRI0281]
MDQGVAAFVAGIVGMAGALGGAAAGGYAAVRGARIAAESAAAATRRQVQEQAAAEHAHWLTDLRREKYSTLVRTSGNFVVHIVPLVTFGQRRDDPDSPLNNACDAYRDQLHEARFLADRALQAAIDDAMELVGNVGHEPYDSETERVAFRHQLVAQAIECGRAIEDAARAELGLPARERAPE